MKIVLNAKEVAGHYEFEVVSMEPLVYKDFVKMYSDLTEWMTENKLQVLDSHDL